MEMVLINEKYRGSRLRQSHKGPTKLSSLIIMSAYFALFSVIGSLIIAALFLACFGKNKNTQSYVLNHL